MYASYIFNVAHHYYRKKFNEFGNSTCFLVKVVNCTVELEIELNATYALCHCTDILEGIALGCLCIPWLSSV